MTVTAAEFADRLDDASRRTNGWWKARCPAHDDTKASLSFRDGDRGLVFKCFRGCDKGDILAKVNLRMADACPDRPDTRKGRGGVGSRRRNTATLQHHAGCTLAAYAAAKQLPIEKLKTFGLTDITYMGAPAVRIPYRGTDGREAAIRIRLALHKGSDGDDRFAWKRGSVPTLYGLDRMEWIRGHGYVVLPEGESDAQTLVCGGVPALGLPGAASWKEAWAEHLAGIGKIFVVIEPDAGGEAVLKLIAGSAIRERVRLVRLTGHKDVSALWVSNPDAFMDRWVQAMSGAEPWAAYADREASAAADTAWSHCATLASERDILAKLDESLDGCGVVGERRAARLVYLSGVSRFLDRIVSVAVKGPSSGGKSYLVQQVLEHFPPDAYYALSAMSERALAYSDEPLIHRMLVIYEAAGMTGDFGTYLIRSLLSEGRIRYETVEKTKDGIRPRLIEREGPTGLITTTTAVSLHPENETRLLSIPVTDTPDQTRRILQALSRDRDDHPSQDRLVPWRALQVWLAAGERRVAVPFAKRVADGIAPVAIRLRRDFSTLLALVKAHALLHRATRDRDATGRVVATVDDYAAVRSLVVDLFAIAAQTSVSETVKQTVTAVSALNGPQAHPVSLGTLAKHLKLDKGTVSRRVRVAVADGYLRNLETKKGSSMQLVTGDPLPEAMLLLPEPSSLRDCCSVAALERGMPTPPPPAAQHAVDADADVF